jgi:hypothetical protein
MSVRLTLQRLNGGHVGPRAGEPRAIESAYGRFRPDAPSDRYRCVEDRSPWLAFA